MQELSKIQKILLRVTRIVTGHNGMWCKKGVGNKVAKGTILYEPCTIGDYNYFAPYSLAYNAIIGNYCSIGPGCRIGLAEHDIHAISTKANINNGYEKMELFDSNTPAVIGNDVWLASNVVVRQGVIIEDGAVIGANAVVTHNIPAYSVAVGIPAKIISYRFDENIIEIIRKSEWFNLGEREAREKVKEIKQLIGDQQQK